MKTIILGYKPPPKAIRCNSPIEINFADLGDSDRQQVEERLASLDPYEILTRKVTHLADLLGVTEAVAEHMLFDRIGNDY
ncbi:MAG: hypothetical protein Q8N51_05695 [Gammaproteobacteria bacterium]|nr:hypothetical protein [Gammaproteobacteria bacterium]